MWRWTESRDLYQIIKQDWIVPIILFLFIFYRPTISSKLHNNNMIKIHSLWERLLWFNLKSPCCKVCKWNNKAITIIATQPLFYTNINCELKSQLIAVRLNSIYTNDPGPGSGSNVFFWRHVFCYTVITWALFTARTVTLLTELSVRQDSWKKHTHTCKLACTRTHMNVLRKPLVVQQKTTVIKPCDIITAYFDATRWWTTVVWQLYDVTL